MNGDVKMVTETGTVCEGPLGRRLQEEGRTFFYVTAVTQKWLVEKHPDLLRNYDRHSHHALTKAVTDKLGHYSILLEGPICKEQSPFLHGGFDDVLIEYALTYHTVKIEEWWQPLPTDLSRETLRDGEFDPTEMSIGPRRRTVQITVLDGMKVGPPGYPRR